MKTYTLTLTEDEAEAVGYALTHAKRELRDQHNDWANSLFARIEDAQEKLENAPEVIA